MKNRKNRIISLVLACIMLAGVVACKNELPPDEELPVIETGTSITPKPEVNGQTPIEGEFISVSSLIDDLREQFNDSETVKYQETLWAVPKNHQFSIDFEFDLIEDTEYTEITEVFAIYADAELTDLVWSENKVTYQKDDPSIPEGHCRLTLRPHSRYTSGRVWNKYWDIVTDEEITIGGRYDYYLHENQIGDTWGFLKHYFLVQFVDVKTSEPLEKPLVTIFTLENQLEAPHSKFHVTEDGFAAFSWNAVQGADYYLIIEMDADSVRDTILYPIAKVTGTEWVHPADPTGDYMNAAFYDWSMDTEDYMNSRWYDGEEPRPAKFKNYTVIAVNADTYSPVGTIHRGENIAARIPHSDAYYTNSNDASEAGGTSKYYPSISLLPVQQAITMNNGVTVYRRITYDFSSVEVKEDWYYQWEEDDDGEMQDFEVVYSTNLYISFQIDGTVFEGYFVAEGIDPDTYREELDALRRQQEESAPRGGGSTEVDVVSHSKTKDGPSVEDAPEDILDRSGDIIFANSALSAFLALNMLAGNDMIDLSAFPESADWEYLVDALFEALYQNPLILHFRSAGTIPGSNLLIVQYDEPLGTIVRQQDEIRNIIPEIIAKIITPGMSDLEKSLAINQYLVDTAEYDMAALENAEENNFQFVDARFNDSFNAYGILINKVGVCAGYAAAYKLLADAAGLDAIVVTGYLEGFLPHAWNRVNIDGHWHTVDVTNNDNEFLSNVILHLPDEAVRRVLVEDSSFMMDAFLYRYTSTDNNSEYYYINDRYYDRDEIAAELVRMIRETGSATLRTDYNLDDAAFYKIASQVAEMLNTNELYGFYWLGVIWITVEP